MINGQVDGSQSYWPPLGVHAAHRTASFCHFPLETEQRSSLFASNLVFFFLRTSGVRVPVKQRKIEVRTHAKNMRLCLLKKNNKTGEKTSVAIGVDLGRL